MTIQETYMQRCLDLAITGLGKARPNPVVGAVLVHNNRIIGEGYHQVYGGPHAEVNCVGSVDRADLDLLAASTMYVSLEPCAHFGKTPPCADLIIRHGIPEVVVGCRDPFKEVDGKGIEKLEYAGVRVIKGMLEPACRDINRRFFTFHLRKRPYVVLKWAQSSDGRINSGENNPGNRLQISNAFSNRLVHKWRAEEAAIMVGTNTALADNPSLTTRLWAGQNPIRIVLDMNLAVPASALLLDGTEKTVIFNAIKDGERGNNIYRKLEKTSDLLPQFLQVLYEMNIQSVLVEGGARLLQSFIDAGLYDEIRVIQNNSLHLGKGLAAPVFITLDLKETLQLQHDTISIYRKPDLFA